MSRPNSTKPPTLTEVHSSERGQVIIEYVLLMLVALGIATFIMKSMVSRNADDAGFLMKKWQTLIEQVASDDPNQRH